MFDWLKNKSELEKLENSYSKLMKNAYIIALNDVEKSNQLHQKADTILNQIKTIENKKAS